MSIYSPRVGHCFGLSMALVGSDLFMGQISVEWNVYFLVISIFHIDFVSNNVADCCVGLSAGFRPHVVRIYAISLQTTYTTTVACALTTSNLHNS